MNETAEAYEIHNIDGGVFSVRAEVSILWNSLHNVNSPEYKHALDNGFDPSTFPADVKDFFTLSKAGAGFEASAVDLIVTFLSGSAAKDLWTYIILPQLRHKFGDKALEKVDKNKKKSNGS